MRTFCCTFSLFACLAWMPIEAQESLSNRSFPSPANLAQRVAIAGEPFGVLRIEVPLPPVTGRGEDWGGQPRVLVENAENRIFYPVVSVRTVEIAERPTPGRIGRVGGVLDRVRSAVRGGPQKREVPVALTISALFRGDAPLDLKLVGDVDLQVSLAPASGSGSLGYPQLLALWWEAYTQSAQQSLAGDDFPTLIHKYLVSMLARRFGLPHVTLDPPADEKKLSQPLETLALLAAIEPLRESILQDVLTSPSDPRGATELVPSEPVWQSAPLPPIQGEVVVESLAQRVPPECFYLRFGTFSNYLWFQDIAARYGGDIAQSVLLRGFNNDASERMERMLATRLTTVARMFGDKLIGDMAVIGSDLYMKEGASVGIVFLATNPSLLAVSMDSDRKAVVNRNKDAQLSVLTIAGKSVSLLSTPDNRIRSFYVQDGPFVFISTSQTLMRRFLEVGGGAASLADTSSFRWARSWMPESNDYSVFGYFSPEFFHRLVSPQYQIELRRRLEAIAHLEIAEVAEQVARAEGLESSGIRALQDAGLLPTWFDQRADDARALRSNTGWIDSLRGARGSFLPIADVELTAVSRREAESYATVEDFYQREWQNMDPLLIGLRRFQADDSTREQVAVEAYIAPFEAKKYGWIGRQLGEPTPIELQLPADDAVSVQVHVRSSRTLGIVSDDYHLFGGVKDMVPPNFAETQGLIRTLQALRSMPAYIGGWPRPGIIEQLPLGLGLTQPDLYGFSRLLGGLWRWQNGQLSLLSFDRSIIERAIPHVQPVETQDFAQARMRVADLSGSRIATWINAHGYERAWRSSQGNARFLDAVHQQLKVPGEESLEVAQRLLDVRLQCPLGGEYQFNVWPTGSGSGWWESTAWRDTSWDETKKPLPPTSYSAPWIDWFRGGKVHVTQGTDSLSLVGSIELDMKPLSAEVKSEGTPSLPPMNFDLFGLPMKLFGREPAPPENKPSTRSF